MKTLALALLLCASAVYAQQKFTFDPVVNSTTIDSLYITSGSKTVLALNADAGSVVAGQTILGVRFPLGTKVVSVTSDSVIVMTQAADSTDTLGSLQFGYATQLAYSIGDAYGFPFKIPTWRTVYAVTIEDDDDAQDSIQVIFFDGTFRPTADNAALSLSDADAKKIIRSILMTDLTDLALNKIVSWPTSSYHPLYMRSSSGDGIWVQLVARGAATHTGVSPLRVTIFGE